MFLKRPLFRIGRPSAEEQKLIDEQEKAEEEARKQKKHEDEVWQMNVDRTYREYRKPE